jgi:hypothetical protein
MPDLDAVTEQMIEHFDGALLKFETDVHNGTANVRVVSNRGGGIGGGGSLHWLTLLTLLPVAVIRGNIAAKARVAVRGERGCLTRLAEAWGGNRGRR